MEILNSVVTMNNPIEIKLTATWKRGLKAQAFIVSSLPNSAAFQPEF